MVENESFKSLIYTNFSLKLNSFDRSEVTARAVAKSEPRGLASGLPNGPDPAPYAAAFPAPSALPKKSRSKKKNKRSKKSKKSKRSRRRNFTFIRNF